MNGKLGKEQRKKSVFRAIFVPVFLIMILQGALFFFSALYGGVVVPLRQNASDILTERLLNRKNEVETQLIRTGFDTSICMPAVEKLYSEYEAIYGAYPLTDNSEIQINFLNDFSNSLITTLRQNELNGVFLILNNQKTQASFVSGTTEKKYGLCIRDMDQTSAYTDRSDLIVERSPSLIADALGCPLDSFWEARYSFESESDGGYYYYPLNAAWSAPKAEGKNLAYLSDAHRISESDVKVFSYSFPLISQDGYPYAVMGFELTVKYLASLLPNGELSDASKTCYIIGIRNPETNMCTPIAFSGSMYNRSFNPNEMISLDNTASTGGFTLTGRDGADIYGCYTPMSLYNNNNPFESREIVLVALVESNTLFSHIKHIEVVLLCVSLFSLIIGIIGVTSVSRRFAKPITSLARHVSDMKPQSGFHLGRLGITEIDRLVDSIEELNKNVSRSSARTEFFSRMSHDMRTPMNAIIGFSSPELLEDADADTKDDYLKKIHRSGEYLLGLINEVLDITKIDNKKIELSPVAIQAVRLCETTVPIIEKLSQQKSINFIHSITISPDIFVIADTRHIDQVVMNLLSNAVKFTENCGTVRLSISIYDNENDDNKVTCVIIVSDNGIGMSSDFMNNLYQPFEQENAIGEGTGLGLSICKRLTDLMGGTIKCISRKDFGTTFTVKLPLEKCPAESVGSQGNDTVPAQNANEALNGKRILVCEDNTLNMQIICRLLEKKGLIVEKAVNGKAGVDLFENSVSRHFDAILMDVRMPIMDGLAATRAIRSLDRSDAKTVPILAMTANAFEEDENMSKKAGMNAHLAKPVEPKKLFDTLIKFICK